MQLSTLNNQTMSSIDLLKLINKARKDFNEKPVRTNDFNGRVVDELEGDHYETFVVQNSNGTSSKVFKLTLDQCLLVSMRESKAVRRSILEKIKSLELKQNNKALFEITRSISKGEYLPMTDAIKGAHEEIKPYHFSNEADLINRIALGVTASKFRKHHDIGKNDLIRDYMTTEQLNCIISLQRANTVYIEDGLSFDVRKDKLTKLFDKKHKQKLIDEIHRLEA